jgi:prepilin-type N-terminal cleavage/methylation domain-containing protein
MPESSAVFFASPEGAMRIPVNSNGFSMIELIIVLAVMGFLAAIAAPNWNSLLPNYALNNSTRQVQSELHNIKMRAVRRMSAFSSRIRKGQAGSIIKKCGNEKQVDVPLALET